MLKQGAHRYSCRNEYRNHVPNKNVNAKSKKRGRTNEQEAKDNHNIR
jgi:hypothetical protein